MRKAKFLVAIFILGSTAHAQFTPGGQTQTGPYGSLPDGCVGSYPNMTLCRALNWNIGSAVDECAPPKPWPVPGQQVYVKDELNFCINLPNPDSIFLQNNFYSIGKLPTIVQAEGFVQSFCVGAYLPPGAKQMPVGGIRSAQVIKNYTGTDISAGYIQIAGKLDCGALNINCTQSSPGTYDDGGQYDNVGFINCGKEPYSGVDTSATGNLGAANYVEIAGEGIFCMRICGSNEPTGACSAQHDTAGCYAFMGVSPTDSWSFLDASTGDLTTTSVSLPTMATVIIATSAADVSRTTIPGTSATTATRSRAFSFTAFNIFAVGTLAFIL